jgi:oxygen-dependent protoporphyrinogen oxidase
MDVMRVAVIGGGLSGWCAAYELSTRGHQVRLWEAATRFGGQIETRVEHGFVVELGAEGFVARSTAIPDLCRRLKIDHELAPQTTTRALGWNDGCLSELAPGEAARLLGIAADPADLGRGLATLRPGMSTLLDALERACSGVLAKLATPVERLERRNERWAIVTDSGELWTADAIVLAVPPAEAARLLGPVVGDLEVKPPPHASPVTVSLAYRRAEVAHSLDASGVVVTADVARRSLRACTFSSSKFAGRAPDGWCLLRAFFDLSAGDRDDDAWRDSAHRALEPMLGLRAPPSRAWVIRWPGALLKGRDSRVAEFASALAERTRAAARIEPAWVGVEGIGIDGAVRAGVAAARRLDLSAKRAAAR